MFFLNPIVHISCSRACTVTSADSLSRVSPRGLDERVILTDWLDWLDSTRDPLASKDSIPGVLQPPSLSGQVVGCEPAVLGLVHQPLLRATAEVMLRRSSRMIPHPFYRRLSSSICENWQVKKRQQRGASRGIASMERWRLERMVHGAAFRRDRRSGTRYSCRLFYHIGVLLGPARRADLGSFADAREACCSR